MKSLDGICLTFITWSISAAKPYCEQSLDFNLEGSHRLVENDIEFTWTPKSSSEVMVIQKFTWYIPIYIWINISLLWLMYFVGMHVRCVKDSLMYALEISLLGLASKTLGISMPRNSGLAAPDLPGSYRDLLPRCLQIWDLQHHINRESRGKHTYGERQHVLFPDNNISSH